MTLKEFLAVDDSLTEEDYNFCNLVYGENYVWVDKVLIINGKQESWIPLFELKAYVKLNKEMHQELKKIFNDRFN